MPILYRTGRIDLIPEHYARVGTVSKTWGNNVLSVDLAAALTTGARLAIETGDRFEEIAADSLQVEKEPVATAQAGTTCGIACENARERFSDGAKVYVVAPKLEGGGS